MNNMPSQLREELANDPYYKICARRNHDCHGRITWEHCFTYAGRQIQKKWAIIPLCVFHHLGAGLNKRLNREIAFRRASEEDLAEYPNIRASNGFAYLVKK